MIRISFPCDPCIPWLDSSRWHSSSAVGGLLMLSLAWLSLAALVLVVVLSCTTAVNPGFLSIALAWAIGIYLAPAFGRRFTVGEVLAGFPTDLFVTLVGVTLLFT